MPGQVQPEEPITRFIFSSSHFSIGTNRVKHNAFMPPPGGASVYRTSDLLNYQIWAIGHGISAERNQHLHARGDLFAHDVISVGLEIVPAEPPIRHANITGWPESKDRIKLKAINLAEKAKLELPI